MLLNFVWSCVTVYQLLLLLYSLNILTCPHMDLICVLLLYEVLGCLQTGCFCLAFVALLEQTNVHIMKQETF